MNIIHKKPKQRNIAQTMETVDRSYLELQCRYCIYTFVLKHAMHLSGLKGALKKISVMHVIKLGFAPVSFPPG